MIWHSLTMLMIFSHVCMYSFLQLDKIHQTNRAKYMSTFYVWQTLDSFQFWAAVNILVCPFFISYFAVDVIKHNDQKWLIEEFILVEAFPEWWVHHGGYGKAWQQVAGMTAGARSWEIRFSATSRKQSENCKWDEAVNSSSKALPSKAPPHTNRAITQRPSAQIH